MLHNLTGQLLKLNDKAPNNGKTLFTQQCQNDYTCENNLPCNQLLGDKIGQNIKWFPNIKKSQKILSSHKTLFSETFPSNALSDVESQNK